MKALFAGSFDPFTIGHDSIVRRALHIFPDGVIIAVGINCNKIGTTDTQQRLDTIRRIYRHEPRIQVIALPPTPHNNTAPAYCCVEPAP